LHETKRGKIFEKRAGHASCKTTRRANQSACFAVCGLSLSRRCKFREETLGSPRFNGSCARYSITASARATSAGGMVRPRALAVSRLGKSSTFVDCCTGRSPNGAKTSRRRMTPSRCQTSSLTASPPLKTANSTGRCRIGSKTDSVTAALVARRHWPGLMRCSRTAI